MLISELDADKNLSKAYVLGNEYVGQSTVTQLNGNLAEYSYYITDEQGSVRYVLGADCNVQNYYQYSAFGESIVAEETTQNHLRYNAQISDDLTGLYYLRARYFNPATGRFIQEDVIYNDGLNLYAYCNSNPVMYCDPSGFAKGKPVSSSNDDIMDIFSKTTKDNIIPSGDDFIAWFDGLTTEDVRILYSDKNVKKGIERKLRNGGGKHEWLAVSKAPQWKKWGTSVSEVLDGATVTEEIKFKNILKADGTIASGPHGITSGGVSDAAHKELFDIIDSSADFDEYKYKLNDWADEHFELVDMDGKTTKTGAVALPENLQTEKTKSKCKKK